MPEIKNTFLQGKMNKDLDERLIPNGQYRHAMNVEVSTAENSNIGTVRNIVGNHRVEQLVGEGFSCVGSVADEKTNKLYWFVSRYDKDMILEYDSANDIALPIVVDLNAGNHKAVLKFSGNIITGINIIDNLLFWTDNNSEPKKINIDTCKAGTDPSGSLHTQLQFKSGSFDGMTIEKVFTPKDPSNPSAPWADAGNRPDYKQGTHGDIDREKNGVIFFWQRKHMAKLLGIAYNDFVDENGITLGGGDGIYGTGPAYWGGGISADRNQFNIRHYRNGEFLGVKLIQIQDTPSGTWAFLANTPLTGTWNAVAHPSGIQLATGSSEAQAHANAVASGLLPVGETIVLGLIPGSTTANPRTVNDWHVGDVIFGDNINLDIEERHIIVLKPKPLNALSVKINHSENPDSKSKIPNLFETKFPRFSYRYKYSDGEYSTFAPFTDPVFNPKYAKDTTFSNDTNTLYNKDTAYGIKEPYNKAMTNSIHSVELTNFITAKTSEDVIEVELLYKQEESSVIYSIGTIQHLDSKWHSWSNDEDGDIQNDKSQDSFYFWNDLYSVPFVYLPTTYAATGDYNKGKYIVTTENIYAALPANQLLRPWDNVPKKALAQEVTGNRIVYGNYVQNYNLNKTIEVSVDYNDRDNKISNFETGGLPSIKSQRNYQLGVVYCDKHGRETPVFTSNNAAVTVPWKSDDGDLNASKSLQLITSTPSSFPEWVDSLKFFIKENSNQYYNLVMDRAWVTKSTYELDNSEGHMWLSFPSSDRNKVSEGDYIILKKKIGTGEEQVGFENKFKIIDIKNEAPDALKYQLVNYGVATNHTNNRFTQTVSNQDPLFPDTSARIDYSSTNKQFKGTSEIVINKSFWLNYQERRMPLHLQEGDDGGSTKKPIQDDLYISWFRGKDDGANDNAMSRRYKVVGGWVGEQGYVLRLSAPIAKIDADIAHVNGDSSISEPDLYQDLLFQVEKRIIKDQEDFSGKFFVKISKNQVTDLIESGNPVSIIDKFQVKSKTSLWYWQDDITSSSAHYDYKTDSNKYGLTNYNGVRVVQGSSSRNHLHYDHATNPLNNDWGDDAGDLTNTRTDGEMRLTDFATPWKRMRDNTFGPTFFIDSMHMAAGQSEASDYAKYCCVTWSGARAGQPKSAEDSSWSYPPLKTWLSDFGDIEKTSDLISTSPVLPDNPDFDNRKIDGWVGPLQKVSRNTPGSDWHRGNNHVNGLEGFVTTTENHSKGPRRWFSGITGSKTEHGVGTDTKTYAEDHDDIGRHFMHLSFFAPGKDLHDGKWNGDASNPLAGNFEPTSALDMIYGKSSFAARLQGIWGGGVFTGEYEGETFGDNAAALFSQLPMEGNYDDSYNYLPETPAPGVGFGYDLKYKELHERQWDPTFNINGDDNNEIRDFIRNLHPGSKFRFHRTKNPNSTIVELVDDTVYTIKKVQIKKLYNHTSWRKPYNRFISTSNYHPDNGSESHVYQSVEEAALTWLDSVDYLGSDPDGDDNLSGAYGETAGLIHKITDFGASHNRRVCYIIELDKNPADSSSAMSNPLNGNFADSSGTAGPNDGMSADYHGDNFTDIEFLDPIQDHLLTDLSKFPAIWELDPKKQEVDLDIYYEATGNIPVKINKRTNGLFAPVGCKVQILNSLTTSESVLISWRNNVATFKPGFPKGSNNSEIDYSGKLFKFIRQDGGYTIAEAGSQDLDGIGTGVKTEFVFREDVGEEITAGLSWNNCFSFGNGVESNRIKDDFNEPFITNGVKASTTIQETYKEERRKNGLIYSGIYNSNSGINDLNQFIMAEKITKDLNPTYGSIQKLFSRNTDLVAFCEDKVIKVLANKDAVFNADGNPQLTANENVLGQTIPFIGEYGIATNPESFSSESYRAYFTDKQRGAVLRLSKDGLTPISEAGMSDWFRDNLTNYHTLIGTYDSYKENYNLTLSNIPEFSENFILDSYLDTGEALEDYTLGSVSLTNDGMVSNGSSLLYMYEQAIVNSYGTPSNEFSWDSFDQESYDFTATVSVVHHAEIKEGDIQPYISPIPTGQGYIAPTYTATAINVATGLQETYSANTEQAALDYFNNHSTNTYTGLQVTNFQQATYSNILADSGSGVSGRFWDADFDVWTGDIWGNGTWEKNIDPHVWGKVRRKHYQTNSITEGFVNEDSSSPSSTTLDGKTWDTGYDPAVQKTIAYPGGTGSDTSRRRVSNSITRNTATNNIVFDRVINPYSFIETYEVGGTPPLMQPGTGNWGLPSLYGGYWSMTGKLNQGIGSITNVDGTTTNTVLSSGALHRKVMNGEEIHVEVTLVCYPTVDISTGTYVSNYKDFGYNYIIPAIKIRDGNSAVNPNAIWVEPAGGAGSGDYEDMKSPINGPQQGYPANTYEASVGMWVFNGFTKTTDSYGWNYANYYVNSDTAVFPSTSTISDLKWTAYPTAPTSADTQEVKVRASWKFVDPDQQNSDGSKKSGVNNIEDKVVVNDLRVRLYQKDVGGYGGFGYDFDDGYSTQNKNPLWEIKDVKITKGYGVTAVHVDPTFGAVLAPQTDPGDPGAAGRHEVIAVPPKDVPAWTEVIHHYFGTDTSLPHWVYNYNANTMFTWGTDVSMFGKNYSKRVETGLLQDTSNVLNPPSTSVEYSVPFDWDAATGNAPNVLDTSHNNYGSNGSAHQPTGIGTHGLIFDRVSQGDNNYSTSSTPALITYNEEFIEIGYSGSSQDITYDISSNPWVSGEWYLVDVEFDSTFGYGIPTNPGDPDLEVRYANLGHPNGQVMVLGAGANYASSYSGWGPIDTENGVGRFTGAANFMHVALIPTKRTEYGNANGSGDNRIVLRGIFKVDGSSAVIANTGGVGKDKDELTIRFYNFNAVNSEGIKVNKIIAKKLSTSYFTNNWLPNSGVATHWNYTDGSTNGNNLVHMFKKKHIYFQQPGLCWEVPANKADGNYSWYQEYTTSAAPTISGTGWELSFTVKDNPRTQSFSGEIEGSIAIDDGSGNPEGLYFGGITSTGNYLIKFNFNGNTGVYNPSASTQNQESWVFLSNTVGYTPTNVYSGTIDIASNMTPLPTINRLTFKDTASSSAAQEYSISDIQLLDSRTVFLGGSAGSWNFDQFNPSTNNYIYWKTLDNNDDGEYLVFLNCPVANDYGGTTGFVNVNQQITKTINQFEQYKIKFTHSIDEDSTATLAIYYYNSDGYGFKISGINHDTGIGTGQVDFAGREIKEVGFDPLYPKIVTIGELDSSGQPVAGAKWNNMQPSPNQTYNADLVNSFVIAVQGNEGDTIDGTIDNISMQRAFTMSDVSDQTITFSEKVNGWTSFKSFIPENGLSLSKKYFTFNKGGLYQHYVPKRGENLGVLDNDGSFKKYTPEEANNYNIFYDINDPESHSSITAVLNQEPSLVKTFNTINYEGSQSYVSVPSEVVKDGEIIKSKKEQINVNNAITLGITDVDGWLCESIKTDLDFGTVNEFIKKEGKWFNHIKGKVSNNSLDSGLFSVQGVGMVSSIEPIENGGTTGTVVTGGSSTTFASGTSIVVPPGFPPSGTGGGGSGGY